jgi:protocatechuate 3,4-dioxygenase beta subunit
MPAAAAQTEGPYWVDEMLNRSDIRSDPADGSVKPGLPLKLALTFHDVRSGSCSPVKDAQVDIWQCDATGLYSDKEENRTRGKKFLRGYQMSDANGGVQFVTVYPGWYQGRTTHIHFRVRRKQEQFTAQLFFPDDLSDHVFQQEPYNNRRRKRDVRNSNDMVLHESEGGGAILYPAMKSDGQGYAGAIDIGIDFNKQAREFGPPPGGRRGFGPPPPPRG